MNPTTRIAWVLRIAVAGEFVGHGAFAAGLFGTPQKAQWVGWIQQFGIADKAMASQLLWLVGAMDVALALLILVKPVRLVLLWMTFWRFWTALCGPWWASRCGTSWSAGLTGAHPLRCSFCAVGREACGSG